VYTHISIEDTKLQNDGNTVRGVRGSGIRMLTLDTKTSLFTEDRGFQVPMTLDHDKIVRTQFCDTLVKGVITQG
jgi:hypothetical protein